MLGGNGYYKGSSILITGSAGTGKSSMAATFADITCKNGKKCLYLAFEESPKQIIRNMRSIGIDLQPWLDKGLLKFQATRPTIYGLETHLVSTYNLVNEFKPEMVIIDPISNIITVGTAEEVKSMLTRLLDFFKSREITTLSTSLTDMDKIQTEFGISSLMDTWIDLKAILTDGERNRTIDIVKTRGMFHSNQVREFNITNNGLKLTDVYLGPAGMLTGSARITQIAKEKADKVMREREINKKKRELERKRIALERKISELTFQFDTEEQELLKFIEQEEIKEKALVIERDKMRKSRNVDKDE
jgi:circadian clock protein KaiC